MTIFITKTTGSHFQNEIWRSCDNNWHICNCITAYCCTAVFQALFARWSSENVHVFKHKAFVLLWMEKILIAQKCLREIMQQMVGELCIMFHYIEQIHIPALLSQHYQHTKIYVADSNMTSEIGFFIAICSNIFLTFFMNISQLFKINAAFPVTSYFFQTNSGTAWQNC